MESEAPRPPRWRAFRVAQASALAFGVCFVSFAVLSSRGYGEATANAYAVVWFQLVAYASAAAASTYAASASRGRRRWAWGCLAVSPAAAAVGILALVYVPGVPTAAFLFGLFVLVNGIGLAGLLLLLPSRLRHERQAIILVDTLIAAGSLFSILWILVLGRLYAASAATFFDRLTTVLYPSLAVAVLTLVIVVFSRSPREVRPPLRYLLAAWSVLAAGLPIHSYLALQGHAWAAYVGPGAAVVAMSLQALAALRVPKAPPLETPVPVHPSPAADYLPYAPLFVSILVVGREYVDRGAIEPLVFAISIGVVGLMFVRLLLAQVENRRINRELAESGRFKTEMLHFIGHEIANPLTPLVIQQALLAKTNAEAGPVEERARLNLEVFSRSVNRLQALSQDVRSLAQLDAGRLPIERRLEDLVVETRKAVEAARPTAEQRRVSLNFLAPKASAPAHVDSQRYGQVVDNLLSNALKFTPSGGLIDVAVVEEGDAWVLVVQDTGAGLSPEQKKRLFTAFGRAHGREVPGLGLGLVICKAIVEGHGGTISVESPGPKRGSQFRARFPAFGHASNAPVAPASA